MNEPENICRESLTDDCTYKNKKESVTKLAPVYQPAQEEPARLNFEHCGCSSLSNPWNRNKLRTKRTPLSLIAYVRTSEDHPYEQQMKIMEDYCAHHGYSIVKVFKDEGIPSVGLQGAMNSLDEAAGLIASDLNRFVEHHQDRLRELRPLIHHFFSHTAKHLITVKEGIDTHSPSGQRAALELMQDSRDCFFD